MNSRHGCCTILVDPVDGKCDNLTVRIARWVENLLFLQDGQISDASVISSALFTHQLLCADQERDCKNSFTIEEKAIKDDNVHNYLCLPPHNPFAIEAARLIRG